MKSDAKAASAAPNVIAARAAVNARCPEELNQIFGDVTPGSTEALDLLQGVLDGFGECPEELAWFCGYVADEIDESGDEPGDITNLSRKLIDGGLKPYKEFAPYPNGRLLILDHEATFKKLDSALVQEIRDEFGIQETTSSEVRNEINAMTKEIPTNDRRKQRRRQQRR